MIIKFGTDGWRAVIGEDFIPDNIAAVVQAYADLYPSLPRAGEPVYVGYDRRNQSPESAKLVAQVLVGNGIPVVMSEQYCPTPCVSWMIKDQKAAAGIMVTASHNPPKWNGIKFKESYGGAANPAFTDPIEAKIQKNQSAGKTPKTAALDASPLFKTFNPHKEYMQQLARMVDIEKIRASGLRPLHDPLFGSGVNFLPDLLGGQVTQIHTAHDTNFGGLHPEPIRPYVDEAMAVMAKGGFDIAVITDGDADRIGALDEKGNYITTHVIYALLLLNAIERKKWRGGVIKSITTTQMLDRICQKYGRELKVSPVGFKYISSMLNTPGMMVGGEESGGIAFPMHVCERDGLLCALMLMELMADTGKTMTQLVADVQEKFGPVAYKRGDLTLDAATIAKAKDQLAKSHVTEIGGMKVKRLTTLDGYHFLREDDSWLMIRPSGYCAPTRRPVHRKNAISSSLKPAR
jgi:alpha-D-glucose phosphate-specific phosphoglucomutase